MGLPMRADATSPDDVSKDYWREIWASLIGMQEYACGFSAVYGHGGI